LNSGVPGESIFRGPNNKQKFGNLRNAQLEKAGEYFIGTDAGKGKVILNERREDNG